MVPFPPQLGPNRASTFPRGPYRKPPKSTGDEPGGGGRTSRPDPKTKSSRRVLTLDSRTGDILRDHCEAMAGEAEKTGELTVSEYVVVDEFGDPDQRAQLTRYLHSLQRRAGLPEITLHDLRDTAATVALVAGVHPKVVSERHGHASTQITLDRYSHVIESMQTAAADAIGQFLTT